MTSAISIDIGRAASISDEHYQKLSERLSARTHPEPNAGCWLWTGPTTHDGYGVLSINGVNRYAHRTAYECESLEPIPRGLFVMHRCDTPECINPAHLVLGTCADNNRDRARKGRGSKARGVEIASSKLTDASVREMRALHAGGQTAASCARAFGVDWRTANRAIARKTWAHVT